MLRKYKDKTQPEKIYLQSIYLKNIFHLEQESTKQDPLANSDRPFVFVNKVLLIHSHIHPLTSYMLFSWHKARVEIVATEITWLKKPKIFILWPFEKIFANLWSKELVQHAETNFQFSKMEKTWTWLMKIHECK